MQLFFRYNQNSIFQSFFRFKFSYGYLSEIAQNNNLSTVSGYFLFLFSMPSALFEKLDIGA